MFFAKNHPKIQENFRNIWYPFDTVYRCQLNFEAMIISVQIPGGVIKKEVQRSLLQFSIPMWSKKHNTDPLQKQIWTNGTCRGFVAEKTLNIGRDCSIVSTIWWSVKMAQIVFSRIVWTPPQICAGVKTLMNSVMKH